LKKQKTKKKKKIRDEKNKNEKKQSKRFEKSIETIVNKRFVNNLQQ